MPRDNPALSARPRGETDADGRISWDFGDSPDADARTLRLGRVEITYLDEGGFPAQENVDLRTAQVGVPVESERVLKVGANPDAHRDIWIRCQDTKGAELTPVRVVIDTVADDRPWSVGSARVIDDPFYDASGRRLWRLRGIRFDSNAMTDKARGTIVRVEAEERGIQRFDVPVAAWQAASSAKHALLFKFEEPDLRDNVVQVMDVSGKPQGGAVVIWMPYDGKSPYDWTFERGSATADGEGKVPMGHLSSGFPYRVFAFDPRARAAGRLDDYHVETSGGITRLSLYAARALNVRVHVAPGAKLVAAGMVTNPRLMLPDVTCRLSEDGWIRADPVALECYELGIGVTFGQRRVGKSFAAHEVQGTEIEFPDPGK